MAGLQSYYLVVYNVAQALGWGLVVVSICANAWKRKQFDGAFEVAGQDVCILQGVAVLEVLHAAVGFVRSGVVNSLIQWGGRSHVLFAVLLNTPQVQKHPVVWILFLAWGLSEVIRYPQYALSTLGICPHWLTWLRYSAFIVLYPLGFWGGEMALMYLALPSIQHSLPFQSVFRHMPFEYYNVVLVALFVSPLFWLQLYAHMFKLRKAKLGYSKSNKGRDSRRKKE